MRIVHSDSDATAPDMVELGRSLREARKRSLLSVQALALQAGVSAGLVSQLERGIGNPSFATLRRLADALQLPLGHFLQGDAPETPMVVRAAERKRLTFADDDLVYELLTPDVHGQLEVLRTQVPPGFDNSARPFAHRGEECVHVLHGEIEVNVGGGPVLLHEGDSVTYDSGHPHWWRNRSDGFVVIIGAVTPPSF